MNVGATGLEITQVDTYVRGEEAYRTDVTVKNGGGGTVAGILYRAGDCYLQGSDVGFGFEDPSRKAVGCSANANNTPPGRIEQFYPVTGGNQYLEGAYGTDVWTRIGSIPQGLPNTCRCGEQLDNGAGLSWGFSLGSGRQSHLLALHRLLAARHRRSSAHLALLGRAASSRHLPTGAVSASASSGSGSVNAPESRSRRRSCC